MTLATFAGLPDGFLTIPPERLSELTPELSLIKLEGDDPRPIVISMLLHGNEPGGLRAVQHWLTARGDRPLPHAVWLQVGNTTAAAEGRRVLDHQPDYNRIWGRSHKKTNALMAHHKEAQPVLAFDLHNSSGKNPHFAGVHLADADSLGLAAAFSDHVVHIQGPTGLFAQAMAELCPSVIWELGPPHDEQGPRWAAEVLERIVGQGAFPAADPMSMVVHRAQGIVHIHRETMFGLGPDCAVRFVPEIESYNFQEQPAGTVIAWVDDMAEDAFDVVDREGGVDVFDALLAIDDGKLVLTRPLVPVMFTTDPAVIRRDCWGYLMERQPATRAPR